tara:strand:- start:1522 stop:2058 length:537 start_codon:yes stop_codon:yes gene_type:complete
MKTKPLIERLRGQVESLPLQSDVDYWTDDDFLMVGPSAGLLCGLTDEELPLSLAYFVRTHHDASSLMMRGLREIEKLFSVGSDLSFPTILLQKWVLLADAVSGALAKRTTGPRLSDDFWLLLGEVENVAREAPLTLEDALSIEDWRDETQLPAEKQIAAIESVLTAADQEFLAAIKSN